jgi:hypothetical protein
MGSRGLGRPYGQVPPPVMKGERTDVFLMLAGSVMVTSVAQPGWSVAKLDAVVMSKGLLPVAGLQS